MSTPLHALAGAWRSDAHCMRCRQALGLLRPVLLGALGDACCKAVHRECDVRIQSCERLR